MTVFGFATLAKYIGTAPLESVGAGLAVPGDPAELETINLRNLTADQLKRVSSMTQKMHSGNLRSSAAGIPAQSKTPRRPSLLVRGAAANQASLMGPVVLIACWAMTYILPLTEVPSSLQSFITCILYFFIHLIVTC
jgi:hypothetical protein